MKTFIVGIATVFLYLFIIITFQDVQLHKRENYSLKYAAEEVSASASLFFDKERYSDGFIFFSYEEGIKAIESQLASLLELDESLVPLDSSYWMDPVSYTAYFYDDSLKCKVFQDGTLVREEDFSYPFLHKDDATMFTKVVTDPVVIVTIDAGRSSYRVSAFTSDAHVIRSAAHEWEER